MKITRLKPPRFRRIYINLMEEVIRRRNIVADVLAGKFGLPQAIAYELCYLQLRLICESIALGCLSTHGGIPGTQTKVMLNAWSPKDILKELERLHPKFYPVPFDPVSFDEEGFPEKIKPVSTGHLTKSDLLKLWGECGSVLHRGVLKDVEKPYIPNFEKIEIWDAKIIRLLRSHRMQLAAQRYFFSVVMQHPSDGKIHGYIQRDDP